MDNNEPLITFFAMGNIAQGTKELLGEYVRRRDKPLSPDGQKYLTFTLHHIDHVREGFKITLRTDGVRDLSELRDLIQQTLMTWDWLDSYNLKLEPDTQIRYPLKQTLAFAHSYVTLGVLPRLPARAVTYPDTPPTYADIPVPHTPGEILARIDELEVVLSETTAKPGREAAPEPLRRTYGFFETSAWLVSRHLGLFLGE
ncbi:MAG: hypothetical protein ACE5HA_12875 [Anaerolineae bacterium]